MPRTIRFKRVLALSLSILIIALLAMAFWYLSNTKLTSLETFTPTDNRPLEVSVWEPEREVRLDHSAFTVVSNKPINLDAVANVDWQELGKSGSQYFYLAKIKGLLRDQVTKTSLTFRDEIDQTHTEEVSANFKFLPLAESTGVDGWPDAKLILGTPDQNTKVDKENRLLEDYVPDDLVDLNKQFGLLTFNNATLQKDAAFDLREMLTDLKTAVGKTVTVSSGYRSYQKQLEVYISWVKGSGQARADEISARPGHSEYQLGIVVDFVNEETAWTIKDDFQNTSTGKWLVENSEKYGFTNSVATKQSWKFRWTGERKE